MHEMSIAVELLRQIETLAEENRVSRVEEIHVNAGFMRQVVPEALDMAFAALSKGTCAEGATLHLTVIPSLAQCRCCGHRFEPGAADFLCAQCGQADVDIVEGNEIVLASMTCEQGEGES